MESIGSYYLRATILRGKMLEKIIERIKQVAKRIANFCLTAQLVGNYAYASMFVFGDISAYLSGW